MYIHYTKRTVSLTFVYLESDLENPAFVRMTFSVPVTLKMQHEVQFEKRMLSIFSELGSCAEIEVDNKDERRVIVRAAYKSKIKKTFARKFFDEVTKLARSEYKVTRVTHRKPK